MKGKCARTQYSRERPAWGRRADVAQVRPGRSSVTGDLRGDAGQTRFRCVPVVKRRGAIVSLGASFEQLDAAR